MAKCKLVMGLVLLAMSTLSIAQVTNENKTAIYFEKIKNSPLELLVFLQKMPKGGDLHHHFGGDNMAENLIEYGKNSTSCVNPTDYTLKEDPHCPIDHLLSHVSGQTNFYNAIINAWSMRNFYPIKESAHDHFFATFEKFSPIQNQVTGKAFAEVLERAGNQNESYIELMIIPDNNASGELGDHIEFDTNFGLMRNQLFQKGLQSIIDQMKIKITQMENQKKTLLACETQTPKNGCDVKVAYLYSVLREQPPKNVFAEMLAAFEIARQDSRFVGVNLVQPEDGYISMRDYRLQMQMLDYLHRIYPTVHIALHAGELNSQLVPPEGLRFHIRDAMRTGHAERIGHGVDIAYEENAVDTLKEMAKKHILVEINLTSNAMILGVEGENHPFPLYMQYQVPVAISTDDEGVERTTLTEEYKKAILTYHLTYLDVKKLVKNSLIYSFLPLNEKNKLLKDIDQRFEQFEKAF